MSELLTNLNSIYTTKLQIKEVIGTDSDNFSEYPQLIEEAIASGAEGTSYITANGVYDIATYAYVDVDVQGGGTAILGYADIVENGTTYASTYGFDGFSYVNVNVPIPPGYIIPSGTTYAVEPGATYCPTSEFVYISWPIPSGTAYITNNGTHDVYGYNYVDVNVSGGGGGSTVSVSGLYLVNPSIYPTDSYQYIVKDSVNNVSYLLKEPLTNAKFGDNVNITGSEWMKNTKSICDITSETYTSTSLSTTYVSGFSPNNIQQKSCLTFQSPEVSYYTYINKLSYYDMMTMADVSYVIRNEDIVNNNISNISSIDFNAISYNGIDYVYEVLNVSNPTINSAYYSDNYGSSWNSLSYDSVSGNYTGSFTSTSGNNKYISFKFGTVEGVDISMSPSFYDVYIYNYSDSRSGSFTVSRSTGMMGGSININNNSGSDATVSISINYDNKTISLSWVVDQSVYVLKRYQYDSLNDSWNAVDSSQMTSYMDSLRTSVSGSNSYGYFDVVKYSDNMWTSVLATYEASTGDGQTPDVYQLNGAGSVSGVNLSSDGTHKVSISDTNPKYIYFNKDNGLFYYELLPTVELYDSNDNLLGSAVLNQGSSTFTLSSDASGVYAKVNGSNYYVDMTRTIYADDTEQYVYFYSYQSASTLTLSAGNVTLYFENYSSGMNINCRIKISTPARYFSLRTYDYDSGTGTFTNQQDYNLNVMSGYAQADVLYNWNLGDYFEIIEWTDSMMNVVKYTYSASTSNVSSPDAFQITNQISTSSMVGGMYKFYAANGLKNALVKFNVSNNEVYVKYDDLVVFLNLPMSGRMSMTKTASDNVYSLDISSYSASFPTNNIVFETEYTFIGTLDVLNCNTTDADIKDYDTSNKLDLVNMGSGNINCSVNSGYIFYDIYNKKGWYSASI